MEKRSVEARKSAVRFREGTLYCLTKENIMGWFSKSEPKEISQETTAEEEADASLKFATASARFGSVGKREETWSSEK